MAIATYRRNPLGLPDVTLAHQYQSHVSQRLALLQRHTLPSRYPVPPVGLITGTIMDTTIAAIGRHLADVDLISQLAIVSPFDSVDAACNAVDTTCLERSHQAPPYNVLIPPPNSASISIPPLPTVPIAIPASPVPVLSSIIDPLYESKPIIAAPSHADSMAHTTISSMAQPNSTCPLVLPAGVIPPPPPPGPHAFSWSLRALYRPLRLETPVLSWPPQVLYVPMHPATPFSS